MYSNFSESKLVEPAFPIYVTEIESGKKWPVKFWEVSEWERGQDKVVPLVDIDGTLIIANGEFTTPVDVDGLIGPVSRDRMRALLTVQEPELCQ